jgi:hypothetical protein
MVEPSDPTPVTGRFAGGLGLVPAEGDLVAWPLAAGATAALTIELWARPDALGGTRDVLISGDNRVIIRVMQETATTVRFVATLVDNGGVMHTLISAPVAAGAWHWVLVTLQEPTMRLWVDGAAMTAGDVTLGTPVDLSSLRLGGNYGGALDEVFVSLVPTPGDEDALNRYCPM